MSFKRKLRKKAISPIIATILLVVVAVILVTVLLTWSRSFTSNALDSTADNITLTRSDAELFIYPRSLKNGLLEFNYSPQSNFGEIIIESYKVLSDAGETPDMTLSSAYTLRQGTNVISLTDFSDLGLEANKKVTIVLQTTDDQYISVKNIANNFTEAPVDLPYVMFGNSKLYIQPEQNSTMMNWEAAKSYCDNLDAHGYADWYLPSRSQLDAIWSTYTYQEGDDCLELGDISLKCINDIISATNDNFVQLIDFFYWSSTESGASNAYKIRMVNGDIYANNKGNSYYVRCVRDQ